MILAAVIVLGTLVAMASGKIPSVLALGCGLAVAGLTRVVTPAQIFSGLSNGGVITVGAMLVVAKGIVQTGAISRVTWRLLAGVSTAAQALRRLAVPVGVGSALMNTTPIVAMLIPASKELEQTRGVPSGQVLLPIAHITTLAGSLTLIGTSSNLLIAGIAGQQGVEMSMFSFAPVALPVALVGALVIYATAPRVLRGASEAAGAAMDWRVEIPVAAGANVLGRTAGEVGVAATREYELQTIERWGEQLQPEEPIEAEDLLIFRATEVGVTALWGSPRFGLGPQQLFEVSVSTGEHGSLQDLEDDGRIRVVAARTRKPFREASARPGDTCYVTGAGPEGVGGHAAVALWNKAAGSTPQPGKTWIAVGVLLAVVISASVGLAAVELIAFAGALLMVLTGVITPRSAVRALDWNVLFILAGSVGLGAVVVSSGLADQIAEGIRYLGGGSVLVLVVVFVAVTAAMTNLVTNAATASILTPIAISIATDLQINPVLVLAAIGTCISFTFINPFSHQSNLMVMTPGGYSTATFARFGAPLVAAVMITAIAVTYLLLRV